jgi:hypothetical protein
MARVSKWKFVLASLMTATPLELGWAVKVS